MTNKFTDVQRLKHIAKLQKSLIPERNEIWKKLLASGDATQAELARYSNVGRSDVCRAVKDDQ